LAAFLAVLRSYSQQNQGNTVNNNYGSQPSQPNQSPPSFL
jgi:hypothetical protein